MPYFFPHAMCKHGWEGGPAPECSQAQRSWAESSRQTPAHGGQSTKTQQQRQAQCDWNLGREGQAGTRAVHTTTHPPHVDAEPRWTGKDLALAASALYA